MLGTFLNFGRDNAGALDSYVYLYYLRSGDTQNVFLKRVAKDQLLADPSAHGIYQYLSAVTRHGRAASWSTAESDARAIFHDSNHVGYYEDWGHYGRAAAGDFLGMRMPNKWVEPGGESRWFVFSGLHELDSFNVIEAKFKIRR